VHSELTFAPAPPGRFDCLAGTGPGQLGHAAKRPLNAVGLGVQICPAPDPTRKFTIPAGYKALSWASLGRVERSLFTDEALLWQVRKVI